MKNEFKYTRHRQLADIAYSTKYYMEGDPIGDVIRDKSKEPVMSQDLPAFLAPIIFEAAKQQVEKTALVYKTDVLIRDEDIELVKIMLPFIPDYHSMMNLVHKFAVEEKNEE